MGLRTLTRISRAALVSVVLGLAVVVCAPMGAAHAAGPPGGVVAYVPVTLTHSQASATPSGFQQQLSIDWSAYGAYLAANVQNVEFFTARWSPLYAWCESSCSSAATAASVWLNLGSNTVGAGGTLTVVMAFYSTSTNEYSPSGYWGAYPTFTGTYGQYDNGASVFAVYDNGAALFGTSHTGSGGSGPSLTTTAPSPNSYAITGSVTGGTAAATTWTTNGETTPALPSSYIAQMRVYLIGSAALTDLMTNVQSITAGQFYVFRIDTRSGSYDAIGNYPSGAASTNFLKQTSITSPVNTWYQLTAVDAGDSLSLYKSTSFGLNSFGTLEAGPIAGTGYTGGGIGVSTDGATSVDYWTMVVVRAYPPAGAMPAVSFGSASSSALTLGSYSDSSCSTSASSFTLGSTVYGKIAAVSGSGGTPWTLNYVDPSGATVQTVSGLTGVYCDSTGYLLPLSETQGTWTLRAVDSSGVDIGESTFTVAGSLPDVPQGALFLFVPMALIYLFARGRSRRE